MGCFRETTISQISWDFTSQRPFTSFKCFQDSPYENRASLAFLLALALAFRRWLFGVRVAVLLPSAPISGNGNGPSGIGDGHQGGFSGNGPSGIGSSERIHQGLLRSVSVSIPLELAPVLVLGVDALGVGAGVVPGGGAMPASGPWTTPCSSSRSISTKRLSR